MKYEKINTLFKRDKEKDFTIIPGDYSTPEMNNVILWSVSEKIDGMNIRVIFTREGIEFRGRTDNAQIPGNLLKYLMKTFTAEGLSEVFDLEKAERVILYGEGYGPKIQKGGKYRDDVSFILFDVLIDDIWMKEEDVTRFANNLDIDRAPLLGKMIHEDVVEFVKSRPESKAGKPGTIMEGVVCRSEPLMLDRMGRRVIFKLKVEDYEKQERWN